MRDVRASSSPDLMRGLRRVSVGGGEIFEIGCRCDSLTPELSRKTGIIQHASGMFQEGTMRPFGNSVLLWSIGSRKFMYDPMMCAISRPLLIHKLPTIICPYSFELVPSKSFGLNMKMLKGLES